MDKVAESISSFIENAISVNPIEMLIQVLATLLLFLVVRYFFWENITGYLSNRKDLMNSEIEEAQNSNLEAQQLKEVAEIELQDVRNSAKTIIDEARDRGEQERTKIVGVAKVEATKVMTNAKKEIDSEIEKAKSSINDEIVSVATLMAEKIIKKEIDAEKHKDLINEVTKGVAN